MTGYTVLVAAAVALGVHVVLVVGRILWRWATLPGDIWYECERIAECGCCFGIDKRFPSWIAKTLCHTHPEFLAVCNCEASPCGCSETTTDDCLCKYGICGCTKQFCD